MIEHLRSDDQTLQKWWSNTSKWYSNISKMMIKTDDQKSWYQHLIPETSMLVWWLRAACWWVSTMRPACWSHVWNQHVGLSPETSMLAATLRPACWSQPWDQHAGLKPESNMLASSLEEEYICEGTESRRYIWLSYPVANEEWFVYAISNGHGGVTEHGKVVDGTYKELMSVSVIRHVLAWISSR